MGSRSLLACICVSAAAAFLLLFGSSGQVDATTYRITYGTTLSCAGPNGTYDGGTGDDSCTEGTYGARDAGLHADMTTSTTIPDGDSYWYALDAFGVPVAWGFGRGDDLPIGAFVGNVVSNTTLSLGNAPCPAAPNVIVTLPMFNCSTDNSAGNIIDWVGSGANLAADTDGNGLPEGCDRYPDFVDNMLNGVRPRARLYGYTNAVAGSPPTSLNFVILHSEQISQNPAPESDMGDALGYANYMILANPTAPATVSTITELCTPMVVDLPLFGLTAGRGQNIPQVGGNPELTAQCTGGGVGVDNDADTVADDGCFVAQDFCGDSTDNDGDGAVDEMCGLPIFTNPAASSGLYGTGTHLVGTYGESYRDYDGDGFDNNHDSCPYVVGVTDDANGCDGCPAAYCSAADEDGDGFMNRQDNCINNIDDESDIAGACANGVDDDSDGIANDGCGGGAPEALISRDDDRDGIGKLCDEDRDTGPVVPPAGDSESDGPYVNDMPMAAVCVGEADTDGDGWCDTTETALNSDSGDPFETPEHYGIDFSVTAAENPPGAAPGTCSDLAYYDTAGAGGAPVDNDGDTLVNDTDNCSAPENSDDDLDGKVNDGCPSDGSPEAGGQCDNAIDDDDGGSGPVNEGCPVEGAAGEDLDPDCICPVGDGDCDGVDDASDNCAAPPAFKAKANPEQLDTDSDGDGDACDTDDDNDGVPDPGEWGLGCDPKVVGSCGYNAFDLNGDGSVNVLDVNLFGPVIFAIKPGTP